MADAIPGVDIPGSGALAALFRVPIPYVLEMRRDGKISIAVSTPMTPQSISVQQPFATAIRFTAGDEPVREPTVNKTWMIAIDGDSGWTSRAGYNRDGQVSFANGPALVKEFEEFLNKYQRRAAHDPDRYHLIFRALDEGFHFKCEVISWSYARDVRDSPLTSKWSLQLQAYAPAVEAAPPNILSPLSDLAAAATAKIQLANAYVALAGNAATNLRGDMEVLRGPLRALQQTAQALQTVTSGVRSIAAFPATLVADFANAAAAFQNTWQEVVGDDQGGRAVFANGWSALNGEWSRLQARLGYVAEDAARESTTVLGYSGGRAQDVEEATARRAIVGPAGQSGSAGQPPVAERENTVSVALRAGEDLRAVARRFYGTGAGWSRIARANGWLSYHRTGSGRPARLGDIVKVPLDIALDYVVPRDPLLVDLWRSPNNDLAFTADGGLRTVRGEANLRQGLAGRLLTVRGDAEGFPQYGLPRVAQGQLSRHSAAYVAAHLREQLLRDPRVSDVRDLDVRQETDALICKADVIAADVDGTPLTLLAPLPATV